MSKDKNKASLQEFFKVYGFIAILGFGLGVGLVFLILFLGGQGQLKGNVSGNISRSQIFNQTGRNSEVSQQNLANQTGEENSAAIYRDKLDGSSLTFLLIGMDNRPEDVTLSNTDSLFVARIDQIHKKMILLSIPRDTQVNLEGKGIQKINAIARLQKGFSSTQKYIETMIGFPIDGYVATNFNGFKSIIDSLGGVTLSVEKDMHYDTGDNQDRYIDLKKGTQRLNGSQALQYARFRNDEMGDITRTIRQQAVMKAMVKEAVNIKNLPKLPFVIPKVYQAVETDLSIGQIWSLATLLKKTEDYQIITQTLPGKFSTEKGISYWKVNSDDAKKVVTQLFMDGKTTSYFTQNANQTFSAKPSSTNPSPTKPSSSKASSVSPNSSTPKNQNENPVKKEAGNSVTEQNARSEKEAEENLAEGNLNQGIQFEVIKNEK
ncbi:LCP family protein [Desulfitobacterium sp.]|uniref:LCP family protein n=1 Tax=Desulfitobacterium sp. TaxID=49981 RepID=UPI002B21C967|nr:LCP family protein [Desulfitobacterium sp.]MEA4902420.1 LCP family protein [Desulfitobacterium sp.]